MGFRPEDLHDLSVAREVHVETQRPNGHFVSTIIWVVVDNGELFIRSVRGASGRWYQDALERPQIRLDDRGRRLEARAVPVHDEESIARVSEALNHKYRNDEGLDEMLRPPALDATFRLEPLIANEQPLEAPAYLGADEPSELGPPIEVGLLDSGGPIEENVILQPHKPV